MKHMLCLLIGGSIILAGCLLADEDGTRSYDRPVGSEAVVTDEKLNEIEDLGVSIYDGYSPPDISGSYAFDSAEWVRAPRSENVGREVCDTQRTYTLQQDGTLTSEFVYTGCMGDGMSDGIFVSGEDDCYTTYSQGVQVFEGCERTSVSITSACVTAQGLSGFQEAFFDVSQQGTSCADLVDRGRLPPEGGIIVVEELDGLVARQ